MIQWFESLSYILRKSSGFAILGSIYMVNKGGYVTLFGVYVNNDDINSLNFDRIIIAISW